ncbi:MAG: hypothetical protein R6T93_03400 [Trueperaceae bacterium]
MKMIVRVSTRLACTEEELWRKLSQPASLRFVAAPILRFVPVREGDLDGAWKVDVPYEMKLSLLSFVPLGRHTIRLVRIDDEANTVVSRESGALARVWSHTISFHEVAPGVVRYTDEIEIRAGWLTPAVWLFAHLFYRHRQRRWKVLLRGDGRGRRA